MHVTWEMEEVSEIPNWFSSPNITFLGVFSIQKLLYLFPRYATDKIVMQEVSYHLSTRLSAALHRKKKAPWPTFLMQIGLYDIKNIKVMYTKGKAIDIFSFGTLDFNMYDPHGIFKDKCVIIHFQWLSGTFQWSEEDPWKNCYNASKSNEPSVFQELHR